MKIKKHLIAIALVTTSALALTACDPPMPPDVAAGILEQSYTCVDGSVTVSFPENMADPGFELADALSTACVEPLPTMTIEAVSLEDSPNFVVSSYAPTDAQCKPTFSMPLATEAADVMFQLTDSSSLYLTPKTLAEILNGEITNWNDAKISAENEGTEFPDLEISIHKQADELALAAMQDWLANLKQDISKADIIGVTQAELPTLEEGEIAIVPHSQLMAAGLYAASVITGTNKETGEQLLAVADTVGIAAGASQWVATTTNQNVTVKLDPKLPVIAQAGLDEAAPPYQAIYPVNIYACGEDTLLSHAIALFLLRLDSQGVLAASNYNPLPESIRLEGLDIARKGLPMPTEVPIE